MTTEPKDPRGGNEAAEQRSKPSPSDPPPVREADTVKTDIFLMFVDQGFLGDGERMADLDPDAERWSLEEHLLIRAHKALGSLRAALAANDNPFTKAELAHILHLVEGGNGGTKPGGRFSAEDVLALRAKLKGVVG